jgi:hypothetical protein
VTSIEASSETFNDPVTKQDQPSGESQKSETDIDLQEDPMGEEPPDFALNQDQSKERMLELFKQDPVAAVQAIMEKTASEIREQIESSVFKRIENQLEFSGIIGDFLDRPENRSLKPYDNDFTSLVRDRGMKLSEAAETLRRIIAKHDGILSRRSAIAEDVRKKSHVETGSQRSNPLNRDEEFDRLMKKAKNLDEMFAGLAKLPRM